MLLHLSSCSTILQYNFQLQYHLSDAIQFGGTMCSCRTGCHGTWQCIFPMQCNAAVQYAAVGCFACCLLQYWSVALFEPAVQCCSMFSSAQKHRHVLQLQNSAGCARCCGCVFIGRLQLANGAVTHRLLYYGTYKCVNEWWVSWAACITCESYSSVWHMWLVGSSCRRCRSSSCSMI